MSILTDTVRLCPLVKDGHFVHQLNALCGERKLQMQKLIIKELEGSTLTGTLTHEFNVSFNQVAKEAGRTKTLEVELTFEDLPFEDLLGKVVSAITIDLQGRLRKVNGKATTEQDFNAAVKKLNTERTVKVVDLFKRSERIKLSVEESYAAAFANKSVEEQLKEIERLKALIAGK